MKRTTALIALCLLAGCSGAKTSGNPTTAPTTEVEQTSGDSGLSIDKFVSKPCDILTAAQLAQLGSVKPGEQSSGVLGMTCDWVGQDVIKNSTIAVTVTKDRDVDDMAAKLKNSRIFEETKDGDVRLITSDETDGVMHCSTIIGISTTDSVFVQVSIAADERATKPACPESEKVAKMIVANLRA